MVVVGSTVTLYILIYLFIQLVKIPSLFFFILQQTSQIKLFIYLTHGTSLKSFILWPTPFLTPSFFRNGPNFIKITPFYNWDLNIKHATRSLFFIFLASGNVRNFRKLHRHGHSLEPATRTAVSTNRRFHNCRDRKRDAICSTIVRSKGRRKHIGHIFWRLNRP